jgi:hypothetical protein
MGALETSLAALQIGSAIVTNVPFISPVAGLILQALQMRGVRFLFLSLYASGVNEGMVKQEVKQYKEDWHDVMEKLADIASIVIDVGKLCQAHGLVEEDLPDGIRNILKSLHRYVPTGPYPGFAF